MAKKNVNLKLGESLTIEQVGELKKKFNKVLVQGVCLNLRADLITDIDLSGIQLLDYMIHQAAKKGADLTFKCKLEESQKELLSKCGFSSINEIVFA